MNEISVESLKQKLEGQEPIHILDVREPNEYAAANLGGTLIPIGELAHRLDELDKNKVYAVLCHSGVRSAYATKLLEQAGFSSVFNIKGGIVAWSLLNRLCERSEAI
jgi:rhodanese-related sulfurtransferase